MSEMTTVCYNLVLLYQQLFFIKHFQSAYVVCISNRRYKTLVKQVFKNRNTKENVHSVMFDVVKLRCCCSVRVVHLDKMCHTDTKKKPKRAWQDAT